MKNNTSLKSFTVVLLLAMLGCSSNTNDPVFLKKVEGRYLYSDDEMITVHSKDNILLLKWRGAAAIEPSKINDDTFYVKEMNAKIQFLTNPKNNKEYLIFLPKNKEDSIEYVHVKMKTSDKIPSQYLEEHNYKKALEGYLAIKAKDSMSPLIDYWNLDRKGLKYQDSDSLEVAIEIFKLNVALHPKVADVYVRLGKAYLKSKDTASTLTNYKKALEFDSGNKHLKRRIEKLQGKGANNTN